jgi:ribosomal protein S18 acetylase RimI-like enzyme
LTASARPESSAARWQLRLEVDEPESRVVTAVGGDGTVIGLAAAGAARDDDAPTEWELYSINVTSEQQGSGMANDLMWLTTRDRDATVWLLSDNQRAWGFYRRHGFCGDGAIKVDEITGAREIRMVRRSAGR